MAASMIPVASRIMKRVVLLLSLAAYIQLNQSGVEGLTSKPRFVSARTASASPSLSSTVPSEDICSKKKRRTRFHYSKKQIPAIQQKQKSLIRGNHPLVSLNLNLDSLAKSGAAPRAQEMLLRIEALHEEGYYQVAPDVVSYNSVLNAWARSSSESSVERAVELFQKQVDSHVRPTLVTYNTLILAFSKRGQAEDAENILRFLLEQAGDIRPDTISFNSVLYAYAVNGDGIHAESLLKEMMQRAADGNVHVKADTISFNTVLHAYRNDPQRAQNLVTHMETVYKAGNEDVEPDVYSYTSVIQAWASSSKNKQAASHAKQLLETMEALAKTQNRPQVAPNTVTYSCVIKALARSRQAGSAQEAQEILQRMMDRYDKSGDAKVKPDVVVFSNVIDAWARDSSEHSATRALELLEHMKQSDIVQPNARTYTSVFRALAKRGESNAAELLLKELRDSSRLQPSTIHYNSVLDAHAKSSNWNKADRAMTFLLEMEAHEIPGDIITYNSVLACCANTYGGGKTRALQVCVEMFQRPFVLEKATPITYFLLFKALGRLLPQSDARRWSLIQQGFGLCCKAGLLSERVLGQVRRACTAEQFDDLLSLETKNGESKNKPVRYSQLPNEWTCNAQQQRR